MILADGGTRGWHPPARRDEFATIGYVAHDRRLVVRKYAGHRRQIAYVLVRDSGGSYTNGVSSLTDKVFRQTLSVCSCCFCPEAATDVDAGCRRLKFDCS